MNDNDGDAMAYGYYLKLREASTLANILILNDLLLPYYKLDQALQKAEVTRWKRFRGYK